MASTLTMQLIEDHLPELHQELWARTSVELAARLDAADDGERAEVWQLIDAHMLNRHRPETSRAILVKGAEEIARKRRDDGRD